MKKIELNFGDNDTNDDDDDDNDHNDDDFDHNNNNEVNMVEMKVIQILFSPLTSAYVDIKKLFCISHSISND